VADKPITEGINFHIEAESDNASKQQLQQLVRLAEGAYADIFNDNQFIGKPIENKELINRVNGIINS
jgi:hypothetical protein